MRNIVSVHRVEEGHWVGDGFPVRTVFSYQSLGSAISPFLLLDYAGPTEFEPSDHPRGVEEHPHRGFETVTIVYQGGLQHRDSGGNHGEIGPGDVQWMTAASGVVHEEMHAPAFTRSGGTLEMVQLWVNLPAKEKMSRPRYQEITAQSIPRATLPGAGGYVRVIAGELLGVKGPACTFTPIDLWDVRLNRGGRLEPSLPDGHTAALLVLRGNVRLNDSQSVARSDFVLLDRSGGSFVIEAMEDATVLVLSGEPINEPVVGRGPFVMNSQEQIQQAIRDYQTGRMGHLGS